MNPDELRKHLEMVKMWVGGEKANVVDGGTEFGMRMEKFLVVEEIRTLVR